MEYKKIEYEIKKAIKSKKHKYYVNEIFTILKSYKASKS